MIASSAFCHGFWVCLAGSVSFGALFFILRRHRHLWLRYLDAESSFYVRLGFSQRLISRSRSFSESRLFTVSIALLTVLFLLLAILNASAYFYSRHLWRDIVGIKRSIPRSVAIAYEGHAKAHRGDLNGALVDYSKAIEIDPKCAPAYNYRGEVKEYLSDLDGAIADFSKTIELQPNYANAFKNRGDAKKAKDDQAGADADYAQAAKLRELQPPPPSLPR